MIFGTAAPKFIFDYNAVSKNFTVVAATNIFTCSAHGLINGQRITVASTVALPAPLAIGTHYYVINRTTDTFKLSLSKNGAEIDITDTGTGTHSLNTEMAVMMNYIVILKDEPEIDLIEHKSVINGHREFDYQGKHWIYEIRMHLYKCSNPRSKYEEIKQYEGSEVVLFRHSEAEPFKDANDDDVLFLITKIQEAYFDTTDYKDILIIRFESKDYIDLSDGSTIVSQTEEIIIDAETIVIDI